MVVVVVGAKVVVDVLVVVVGATVVVDVLVVEVVLLLQGGNTAAMSFSRTSLILSPEAIP